MLAQTLGGHQPTGFLGVVSGHGEVGLISAEEENEGGGILVDSEIEAAIAGDLPEASTASIAKVWA